jgi:hypothetical protein
MINIVVLSADHHGDCFLAIGFDTKEKKLKIQCILENVIDRPEIKKQVEELATSGEELVVVENKVLANYIKKATGKQPVNTELPTNPKETLYRLSCAIKEGNLMGGEWLDAIEVALANEINPDRIDGHLLKCLGYACDRFLDGTKNFYPPSFDGEVAYS